MLCCSLLHTVEAPGMANVTKGADSSRAACMGNAVARLGGGASCEASIPVRRASKQATLFVLPLANATTCAERSRLGQCWGMERSHASASGSYIETCRKLLSCKAPCAAHQTAGVCNLFCTVAKVQLPLRKVECLSIGAAHPDGFRLLYHWLCCQSWVTKNKTSRNIMIIACSMRCLSMII